MRALSRSELRDVSGGYDLTHIKIPKRPLSIRF